jgi:hypothetical protein
MLATDIYIMAALALAAILAEFGPLLLNGISAAVFVGLVAYFWPFEWVEGVVLVAATSTVLLAADRMERGFLFGLVTIVASFIVLMAALGFGRLFGVSA